MDLAAEVKNIFDRLLDNNGWQNIFQKHQVTKQTDIVNDLITVDRTSMGFEDFAVAQAYLIKPGDPALSLLYHAVASPAVISDDLSQDDYLSLVDIDTIENYIYGLTPIKSTDLDELFPVMFAYEYRSGPTTTHKQHADFVFSRTGIGRIGNAPSYFDRKRRCHVPDSSVQHETRIMPVRYGVFMSRKANFNDLANQVLGNEQFGDQSRDFFIPVTKLFTGRSIQNKGDIAIHFKSFHTTDRLRRVFTIGNLDGDEHTNLSQPPFVRDSINGGLSIRETLFLGSSVYESMDAPLIRECLVSAGNNTGQVRYAWVNVPAALPETGGFSANRRYSTLRVGQSKLLAGIDYGVSEILGRLSGTRPFFSPRNCPEFINMRHKLTNDGLIDDLNVVPSEVDFLQIIHDGDYRTVFYLDNICDGFISADITCDNKKLGLAPAFSIITAPDFFPYVKNIDLAQFTDHFSQGGPSPLCEGRLLANQRLQDPLTEATIFGDDETIVSIVGIAPRGIGLGEPSSLANIRVCTTLTDGASNIFAPGWDVTYGRDSLFSPPYYHTVGLGLPFPEDTKLCAAANGMWAAASPDSSRTFNRKKTPTAIPLTDEELGIHPNSLTSQLLGLSFRGWDGEYGPFITNQNGNWGVNSANIMRSDYVSNGLRMLFKFDLLRRVDSAQIISRMNALAAAIKVHENCEVKKSEYWLITFRLITDWTKGLVLPTMPPSLAQEYTPVDRSDEPLLGKDGYLFGFAKVSEEIQETNDPLRIFYAFTEPPVFIQTSNTGDFVTLLKRNVV